MDWDPTPALGTEPDNKNCTKCWTKDSMKIFAEWKGKDVYTKWAVRGTDENTPFVLEGSICKLKCKNGYWSSYKHPFYPEDDDVMKQRCRSEICKTDVWINDIGNEDKWYCSECWSKADMESPDWPGLANHGRHTWEGIDLDHLSGPWISYPWGYYRQRNYEHFTCPPCA
jgi:hypothetical protein